MAIKLPARANVPERRLGAVSLPGAENVPQASIASDPGVRSPEGAFDASGGGVADIGAGVSDVADRQMQVQNRIKTREEAVQRAKSVNAYNEAADAELRRLETEGDLTDPNTLKEYGSFLTQKRAEIQGSFSGSPEAALALEERLEAIRSGSAMRAGTMGVMAQRKAVRDQLGKEINGITAQAMDDPSKLAELFASYDSIVDDMAPALTPDEEEAYRTAGRQEITISALTGQMSLGNFEKARELYATPGVREGLSPAQQREYDQSFTEFDRKEREAQMEARRKIQQAEAIKGAPLTLTERLKLAGLEPKTGEKTPADKVREAEEVLGPLTLDQKAKLVGVDAEKMQTKAGQMISDREAIKRQYGEGSPQLMAFDEAANSEDAPSLSDTGGIRKEFTKLSDDFIQVRDSYGRIKEVAKKPSAAGDLSMIFNFMKMLDPGSTVREGEFANAQSAGGVPQRIVNVYNRLLSGERLAPEQRADFLGQAENLMRVMTRNQTALEDRFKGIAERAGVKNTDDVVVDFIGDFRNAKGDTGAGEDDPGATQPFLYGLDGKPLTPTAPKPGEEELPAGKGKAKN